MNMNSTRHPSLIFLRLTPIIIIAGMNAQAFSMDMTDDQAETLRAYAPETKVYVAPPPLPLKASPVSIELKMPPRTYERVRLVRDGKLVERQMRFESTVTRADKSVVEFSDAYGIGLRLPDGHDHKLTTGQKLTVDYMPVTSQGAQESLLTVSTDTKSGDKTLILQVVQRGGSEQVTIENRDFIVAQLETEIPIQKTLTDHTNRVEAVVWIEGVKQPIALIQGRPTGFESGGSKYLITLIKSLHVMNLAENLSVEGPPYYLEYVITRE